MAFFCDCEGVLGGVILSDSEFVIAEAEWGSGLGPKSAGNGERSGGISIGLSELEDLAVCGLVSIGFVTGVGLLGSGDATAGPDFCVFVGEGLTSADSDLRGPSL